MKEHKQITPLVEKFREYTAANASEEEALMLLEDSELDKEFKELAQEELNEAKAAIERCAEELKILLLPRDPNDDKNVIIEIRGGAGGEDENDQGDNELFGAFSVLGFSVLSHGRRLLPPGEALRPECGAAVWPGRLRRARG